MDKEVDKYEANAEATDNLRHFRVQVLSPFSQHRKSKEDSEQVSCFHHHPRYSGQGSVTSLHWLPDARASARVSCLRAEEYMQNLHDKFALLSPCLILEAILLRVGVNMGTKKRWNVKLQNKYRSYLLLSDTIRSRPCNGQAKRRRKDEFLLFQQPACVYDTSCYDHGDEEVRAIEKLHHGRDEGDTVRDLIPRALSLRPPVVDMHVNWDLGSQGNNHYVQSSMH
ncbi:hypothetical protein BJ508DRAFT_306682 [Ascobolus immersus RN42]|uniref:Uncharacterized protein n=1 Tax=Ascobolus immersus RN42 TaxID=1160509 RepID=A0A3N4I7G7_ASCIM|nr:hypothetical protein BJ508DRAFT_306682 [Ascobolus immersus RN42]